MKGEARSFARLAQPSFRIGPQVQFFHPQVTGTGWRKDAPQEERRRDMLRAHGGDALATARALQALANVSQDPATKRAAAADAAYFYKRHKQV